VHEWLWRGGFEIPGERTEEVRKIYEEPRSAMSQVILDRYGVVYIFLGTLEEQSYLQLDELGVESLGEVVFAQDGVEIVRIR
jgi:uncharacterized membrane protein